MEDRVQACKLPQGVLVHLYRDVSTDTRGHVARVGLGTFVDPRHGGGKVNASTTEDLVSLIELDGEKHLFYKAFGSVIAQVERLANRGTLNPRQVEVPGIFVDCVVVAKPEHHWQTLTTRYNPAYSSELSMPPAQLGALQVDARKLMARRAALELRPNAVVNLGTGVPEGVSMVAGEEKIGNLVTLTAESGITGGTLSSGLEFGTAVNYQALLHQPCQFDFHDGGGLDIAILGLAEAGRHGNANISKFDPKLAGAGGFINISQNAKRLIFVGTFTAWKQAMRITDGQLQGEQNGNTRKIVDAVHICESAEEARQYLQAPAPAAIDEPISSTGQ